MDVSRGRTESEQEYSRKLSEIDQYIKISATAFTLLTRLTDGPGGDRLLGAAFATADQPWSDVNRVRGGAEAVRVAEAQGIRLTLAAILGDFEMACVGVLVDLLEFWDLPADGLDEPGPRPSAIAKRGWRGVLGSRLRGCASGTAFVEECHAIAGATVSERSKEVLPIVDYFRQARNRIIHQQAVASSELSSLSRSKELADARRAFNAQLRRASPDLPEFAVGDVVAFGYRHAIFFKIVVGRVFREFCNQVRPKLTGDGYLRMAAHYSLGTATHPDRGPRHHHAVTAVKRFLYDRYGVRGLDDAKIIKRCRTLGLWTEVSDRFNEMYGSGE